MTSIIVREVQNYDMRHITCTVSALLLSSFRLRKL